MKQSRKKPKLGQHFLKDENVKKRILDTVKNLKVKNIIEIGPGKGALTDEILKQFPRSLFLIEKDEKLSKYLKNKFEICYILRLFNIAGYINKKEFFEFKNKFRRIMPVITEASRKKLPFKINLVKKKRRLIYPARDFVHIKDFLSIIFKILKRNNIGSYIMNVGSGELIYLDNIIKIFEKQMNKKISYKKKFYELGNNNYTLSNNYKLRKILDFDFKLSINEIVKSCIKKKVI